MLSYCRCYENEYENEIDIDSKFFHVRATCIRWDSQSKRIPVNERTSESFYIWKLLSNPLSRIICFRLSLDCVTGHRERDGRENGIFCARILHPKKVIRNEKQIRIRSSRVKPIEENNFHKYSCELKLFIKSNLFSQMEETIFATKRTTWPWSVTGTIDIFDCRSGI